EQQNFRFIAGRRKNGRATKKRNGRRRARLARDHERACRPGTAKERPTSEIFSDARESGISYQRETGHARRILWIDFAGNGFALAATDRHRAERATGGSREPGN